MLAFFSSADSLPSPRVLTDIDEVITRLHELSPDLELEAMTEINQSGYRARLEATPLHAVTAAGTYQWHAVVAQMRTHYVGKDWTALDPQNCPMIVSPDRSIAIIAMTGNSDTGKPHGSPTNQADKGSAVENRVELNKQYALFKQQTINGKQATQMWVLLYHYDAAMREVRFELSLPSDFHKKKIIAWDERIILGTISANPIDKIEQPKPIKPIDVFVEPKTGT